MKMSTHSSFEEAAKVVLKPEEVIVTAARDILASIAHPCEDAGAVDRAIQTLTLLFPNPEMFRADIAKITAPLPSGITHQQLYHFSGRWIEHLKQRATIGVGQNNIFCEVGEILAMRGGTARHKKGMTSSEAAALRKKRSERKGSKK